MQIIKPGSWTNFPYAILFFAVLSEMPVQVFTILRFRVERKTMTTRGTLHPLKQLVDRTFMTSKDRVWSYLSRNQGKISKTPIFPREVFQLERLSNSVNSLVNCLCRVCYRSWDNSRHKWSYYVRKMFFVTWLKQKAHLKKF